MRLRQWAFALLIMAMMPVSACTQDNGRKTMDNKNEQTITYGVGRFVIDIPVSMQYRGGSYRMRNRQIREIIWPDGDPQLAAKAAWEKRFEEIENLKPPEGKDKALIETKDFPGIGKWCKAVFYYGDPRDTEFEDIPLKGYLDILVNAGVTGAWITSYGKSTGKDFMFEKSTDLAKAYRPPTHRQGKASVLKNVDSFYLQYGAIDLPFEYQESTDIYLEGHPIDKFLRLHIEIEVIHKVQPVGLIERIEAGIKTDYVQGLKIKKIKAKERIVAEQKGEEFIYKSADDDGDKGFSFFWESPGEENSSHHPRINITMGTEDGKLDEKLALWETILDGMHPAGR